MAEVLHTEKKVCPFCRHEYIHKVYRVGADSICPKCRRRSDTYRKLKHARVSAMKSPTLKECANPNCDDGHGMPFLFWAAQTNSKYCCIECYRDVDRIRSTERVRKWRAANPERSKAIQARYDKKKRANSNG